MCDSTVQTNNVASYFVQSVSDPFIVRHLYCNICCTDAMFIKEVLTHFTDRNGDMEGKSACLSGCKSSGRAGNRKKRVGQVPRENSGLFLLYIWLVSPAPKIILTAGLNTLKGTLPYIAQINTVLRLRVKNTIALEQHVLLKWCQKLIFTAVLGVALVSSPLTKNHAAE